MLARVLKVALTAPRFTLEFSASAMARTLMVMTVDLFIGIISAAWVRKQRGARAACPARAGQILSNSDTYRIPQPPQMRIGVRGGADLVGAYSSEQTMGIRSQPQAPIFQQNAKTKNETARPSQTPIFSHKNNRGWKIISPPQAPNFFFPPERAPPGPPRGRAGPPRLGPARSPLARGRRRR